MEIFTPLPKGSKHLSASSTSSRVDIRYRVTKPRVLAISHSLGADLFIAFGDDTITATTSAAGYDMVIPTGQLIRIRVPDGVTHMAGITASASGTVVIAPGGGG